MTDQQNKSEEQLKKAKEATKNRKAKEAIEKKMQQLGKDVKK